MLYAHRDEAAVLPHRTSRADRPYSSPPTLPNRKKPKPLIPTATRPRPEPSPAFRDDFVQNRRFPNSDRNYHPEFYGDKSAMSSMLKQSKTHIHSVLMPPPAGSPVKQYDSCSGYKQHCTPTPFRSHASKRSLVDLVNNRPFKRPPQYYQAIREALHPTFKRYSRAHLRAENSAETDNGGAPPPPPSPAQQGNQAEMTQEEEEGPHVPLNPRTERSRPSEVLPTDKEQLPKTSPSSAAVTSTTSELQSIIDLSLELASRIQAHPISHSLPYDQHNPFTHPPVSAAADAQRPIQPARLVVMETEAVPPLFASDAPNHSRKRCKTRCHHHHRPRLSKIRISFLAKGINRKGRTSMGPYEDNDNG